MNKELDTLLCLLDGKITAYRMKNVIVTTEYMKLVQIQLRIQDMWTENNNRGE